MSNYDDPSPEFVHLELLRIFGKRLTGFSMDDTIAFFNVDTRYRMITGAEILRVGIKLNVDPRRIEMQDHPPTSIRFICDCGAVTSPGTPGAIAANEEKP